MLQTNSNLALFKAYRPLTGSQFGVFLEDSS